MSVCAGVPGAHTWCSYVDVLRLARQLWGHLGLPMIYATPHTLLSPRMSQTCAFYTDPNGNWPLDWEKRRNDPFQNHQTWGPRIKGLGWLNEIEVLDTSRSNLDLLIPHLILNFRASGEPHRASLQVSCARHLHRSMAHLYKQHKDSAYLLLHDAPNAFLFPLIVLVFLLDWFILAHYTTSCC